MSWGYNFINEKTNLVLQCTASHNYKMYPDVADS